MRNLNNSVIGTIKWLKRFVLLFFVLFSIHLLLNIYFFYEESMKLERIAFDFFESKENLINLAFLIIYFIGLMTLKKLSAKLIKQVEQSNQNLMDMANQADASNEAKSIFLANMSHEIRTPLNAIIGFSDILSASDLKSNEKHYAGIVARSAKSLLAIINDILDISKIESDVFDINNESFELEPFLEQLIELYSVKSDEKKLILSYYFDSSIPPYILGDSFRLQQVISNLLSNAIKFTPQKGQVELKALLLNKSDDNATIRFAVKDSGIGISPEGKAKIFEPFTQADSSITRKYGGTGLGLSISRKIVDAMNSSLNLVSEKNKGSLFSFDVTFNLDKTKCRVNYKNEPLVFGIFPSKIENMQVKNRLMDVLTQYGTVIEDAAESYHQSIDILFALEVNNIYLEAKTVSYMYHNVPIVCVNRDLIFSNEESKLFYQLIREPFYKSKIEKLIDDYKGIKDETLSVYNDNIRFDGVVLVAEDNSTNQILMRVLLEKLGVTMLFADNGIDAIQKFKENSVDLILMDIHMPILDGVHAMQDIRKIEKAYIQKDTHYKQKPIIALTADAIKGDREKYLAIGMDDYLSKPISYNRLVAVFNKFLKVSNVIKESRVIGVIKELENNELGVLELEESEKNIMLGLQVSQHTKSIEIDTEAVQLSKYNGDDSLSFRERVNLTREAHIRKEQRLSVLNYEYDRVDACNKIGIDDVTLDMLLENFGITYEKDFDLLEKYMVEMNFDQIRAHAHFLKGSAANLRMTELVSIFTQIETSAKNKLVVDVDFESMRNYVKDILPK